MKYTAEEVRDYADACRLLHKGPVIADMLTAYAERIKADEGATQVAWQYRYKNNRMEWSAWHEWAPEEHEENPFPKTIGRWEVEYRKLFTHPPAQAAQGDASHGRCKACGRATRAVCDGLDGNGLGCTNAPSIDIAAAAPQPGDQL